MHCRCVFYGIEPISKVPYRMAALESRNKAVLKIVKGFVSPQLLPWGAPIVFVNKKDGSMCMYINYCELNRVVTKNSVYYQ